jgi:ribosomal protein S17
MKKVKLIRERLHASKSMQKYYVDYKRYSLESNVGDHVFLEVSPIKKSNEVWNLMRVKS